MNGPTPPNRDARTRASVSRAAAWERLREALDVLGSVHDARVLASLLPSGIRGLLLRRGKQGVPTTAPARHPVLFDWSYPADNAEMRALYARAKRGQWNADDALDWSIDVDPYDPRTPILPENFFDFAGLEASGVRLDARERRRFVHDLTAWMLSQFLHGEQGALYAAAQVTQAVDLHDGKLFGSTQVMDEARHVEVFRRYVEDKLGKLYAINDNLFVILDALMADSRWDMKFLGMQIMVEGLALGAFSTLYTDTKEPLLRSLLRFVIQDEARHVHYGVLALRDHFAGLSESERREREDWAFEVSLLMRNRFLAHEIYDEWFEGQLSRARWCELVSGAVGMDRFRTTMFRRLVPNLREIGLLSPRIRPRYEAVGLLRFADGDASDRLDTDVMLAELEAEAPPA